METVPDTLDGVHRAEVSCHWVSVGQVQDRLCLRARNHQQLFFPPPYAGRHNRAGRSPRQSGGEDGALAECLSPLRHTLGSNSVSAGHPLAEPGRMSPLQPPADTHHSPSLPLSEARRTGRRLGLFAGCRPQRPPLGLASCVAALNRASKPGQSRPSSTFTGRPFMTPTSMGQVPEDVEMKTHRMGTSRVSPWAQVTGSTPFVSWRGGRIPALTRLTALPVSSTTLKGRSLILISAVGAPQGGSWCNTQPANQGRALGDEGAVGIDSSLVRGPPSCLLATRCPPARVALEPPSGEKAGYSLPSFASLGRLGQLDRLHNFQDGGGASHADGVPIRVRQGAEEAIDDHAFRYLSCRRRTHHQPMLREPREFRGLGTRRPPGLVRPIAELLGRAHRRQSHTSQYLPLYVGVVFCDGSG